MALVIVRAFRDRGIQAKNARQLSETQSARAASRRAQFQLWIFS
jgi:hypothetical protein